MKDRTMGPYHILPVLLAAAVLCSGCLSEPPDGDDDGNWVTVEFKPSGSEPLSLLCEVADTDEERKTGLMNRSRLPEDEGMLFVYDTPREVYFWMKDTLIPLDIVFISEDRLVVSIVEAEPGAGTPDSELEIYGSGAPVMYVVEMNRGLSAEHTIEAGTPVHLGL